MQNMEPENNIKNIKKQKISLVHELNNLKTDIENIKQEKDKLTNILKLYKEDIDKEKKEIFDDIEDSQIKISKYYNELLIVSEDGNGNSIQPIKIKIQKVLTLAENTEGSINSVKKTIEEFDEKKFKDFYNKINEREEKYTKYELKIENLQKETEKQQKINSNIQLNSEKFLQDITDKTLINTFKQQADDKKGSYKWFFCSSVAMACLVGTIGLVLIIKNGKIGFDELVLLPFIFAYFSLAKQADVNKKLAEEYQHKASLTEYLAGYKKMWELGRDDAEYIILIEEIKKEILKNPNDFIKISNDYIENMKNISDKLVDTLGKINPLSK